MRSMRRLLVVLTAAAMFVTLLAGAALADKPVFQENFVEEIDEEDPGLADACDLDTVHVDGVVRGKFKEFADGSIWEHVVGKIELTGPEGQGPVIISFSRLFEGSSSESFDPETGLLTLVFNDSFKGNPEKWHAPGVGVIVRDAGVVSFTTTIVIDTKNTMDPSDDVLVSEEISDVTVHGPHPIFDNGFSLTDDQLAVVCHVLGA